MRRVVSREEWIAERQRLLVEEKELTRRRDALARKRRELPWVKVEADYRFEGPDGLSLAVEVTLQPTDKSFTDEQISEISKRIVAAAEKLGARLRS